MLTMTSVLERTVLLNPALAAVAEDGDQYTWAEWVERIARGATVLGGAGIGRGERYALISLNSMRQAEAIHAGYWMGATPVPINFRLAPPEIRHVLEDAGCNVVAVDPAFTLLFEGEELGPWRDRLVSLDPVSWDTSIEGVPATPSHDAREEDEALLLYTGGTSGQAKGVPLTHRNIVSNAMQVGLAWPGSRSACVLHVAPMFHAADLVMTPFSIHGGMHVFLPKITPGLLFEAIESHRVTATLLVPTVIRMAAESGIAENYDLSSWRHCVYGTAPMSPELIQRFMQIFPQVDLVQGYGLTETSPILTLLDEETHRRAIESGQHEVLMSCGQPVPGVDIRIVDDAGLEVEAGEAGELVARGPNVFGGYLNLPEVSEGALRAGWFHTGDVGRLGSDGYYYLLDRKQNLIITGGENVYSNEVESILYQHPSVQEVAVIGLADMQYGEVVTAVVVADASCNLTGIELQEFCRGKIGGFKIPRRYEFCDELPKSAVGKTLKRVLREMYTA